MSVWAAYLGVVVIWATTPLSIKWGSEGVGPWFSATGRMLIGAALCLALLRLLGARLPWHAQARRTYLAAGLGIYGAMQTTYWSAQFIPSGLMSVIFGLAPIATALMARLWLGEHSLTAARLLGLLLGLAGLTVIFGESLQLGPAAHLGIAGIVVAVLVHSASAVWVKRLATGLPALAVTTGGLLCSLPLFLATWIIRDGVLPQAVSLRAGAAIVYTGIFGSALGFSLYYYVLKHLEASRVALITLITPVLALVLGQVFNHERIPWQVLAGAALISLALVCYQWGDRFLGSRRRVRLLGVKRPAAAAEPAD